MVVCFPFSSNRTMTTTKDSKAQGILERLARLEESQHEMMEKLKSEHEQQMSTLRAQLADAEARRKEAEQYGREMQAPVLVDVNMTEVNAAVQAASFAEQESAIALEEARKVAEDARLAAGGIPQSIRDATKEGDVGFGADSEYIVKKVSVNLDHVERVVSSSPLVSVCRAFGRPDAKYGNEVYCAVVPKRNVRVSEPMLVIHAQKHLPTAMVPKRFFFLQDMPPGITRKALADTQISDQPKKQKFPALEN